jgi:UTP--glucose-1-phosphate uridylyltransferase
MAAIGDDLGDGTFRINSLVEKPGMDNTPSEFASVGGYLLTSDILPIIEQEIVDKNGEITLSQSINELARTDAVYGQFIEGTWHDTGDQLKYLMALVDVALESPEYGTAFADYLKKRL